jgi:magnesium transporter
MESYLSATSNRLNQTMRTLTALTIGLMIPTLIAGIYGMNLNFVEFQQWEYGFPIVVTGMLVSGLAVLAIFKFIDWL